MVGSRIAAFLVSWLLCCATALADATVIDAPLPAIDAPADSAMRDTIRRELIARRRLNLERFQAYVRAEVYPLNTYQPGYLNVFIDAEGHICAAATIMTMDGLGDLVRRQATENNFIRLADVHEGALYDWILASGFTQEELAMIQEPFFEPQAMEPSLDDLREQEKIRLRARYTVILSQLQRDQAASIEIATDRLLAQRL